MAKTTIYDLDGQGHEMETVDARECVAEMGWSYEQEPEEKSESGPTREAMKSFLTTCGVTFPANIKGDKLAELYAAEKAKFEAD